MNFSSTPYSQNSDYNPTNSLQPLLASLQAHPSDGTSNPSMFEIPGDPDSKIQNFFKRPQIANPDKFEIFNSFDIYGNQLVSHNEEGNQFEEEYDSEELSRENSSIGPIQGNQENTNPWTNVITPLKNTRSFGTHSTLARGHLAMNRSPLLNITPTVSCSDQKDQKIERMLMYNSISGEKNNKKNKKLPSIKNYR